MRCVHNLLSVGLELEIPVVEFVFAAAEESVGSVKSH